jgi:hypothetical protein
MAQVPFQQKKTLIYGNIMFYMTIFDCCNSSSVWWPFVLAKEYFCINNLGNIYKFIIKLYFNKIEHGFFVMHFPILNVNA